MTTGPKSLWPDSVKGEVETPRMMIEAQAEELSRQTGGVLLGEVTRSEAPEDMEALRLAMFAPALNYRQVVLTVTYNPEFPYPARVDAAVFRPSALESVGETLALLHGKKPKNQADSDDELRALIGKALKSSEVVSVVQSLVALSAEKARTVGVKVTITSAPAGKADEATPSPAPPAERAEDEGGAPEADEGGEG